MRVTGTTRPLGSSSGRVATGAATRVHDRTGCCESTAPFLYEDFWPGPDAEQVGEVAGVPVFAPTYLGRGIRPKTAW